MRLKIIIDLKSLWLLIDPSWLLCKLWIFIFLGYLEDPSSTIILSKGATVAIFEYVLHVNIAVFSGLLLLVGVVMLRK